MDELEKKAQQGLESFGKKGDIDAVKTSLDSLVDDMLTDDDEIVDEGINKGNSKKWILIGLAILSLCLIGYLGFKDGRQQTEIKTPKAVYAQYFEVLPDALSANERGVGENVEEEGDALLGMRYYNEGNFKKAAEILKRQNDSGYKLFAAIAEMENDQTSAAIDLLEESKKMDVKNIYRDINEWYLSLAYLKNGQLRLAKESLTSISKEEHYKKSEALLILKELD